MGYGSFPRTPWMLLCPLHMAWTKARKSDQRSPPRAFKATGWLLSLPHRLLVTATNTRLQGVVLRNTLGTAVSFDWQGGLEHLI